MTFLAEVAPVAPAAGSIVALLESVLLFALAVALSVLWFHIIRKVAVRIAGLSILRVHPFGFLHDVIAAVDKWVRATEQGTERAVVWSIHALMWSLSTGYKQTRDLAAATWHFFTTIPHAQTGTRGAAEPRSIGPRVKTLEREYKGIDQRLDHVEKRERAKQGAGAAAGAQDFSKINVRVRGLNDRVTKLEREYRGIDQTHTHVGTRTVPGAKVGSRTATKPRAVPRTKAPARSWSDVLTNKAAWALGAAAIAKLGMSWLRCASLGRIGRKIGCGGWSWLEPLFADTFAALVVLDLCRYALAAQKLARLVVPQLGAVLLVQDAVCLGGGATLPSAADAPRTLTVITKPSAHD